MKIHVAFALARRAAAIVALVASAALPAKADDFFLPPAAVASLPPGVQDNIKVQSQMYATGMLNQMLLRLDEINRVCTLSGSQRLKLKVAAKGAVEYAIQDWIGAMGQQLGAANVGPATIAGRAFRVPAVIVAEDDPFGGRAVAPQAVAVAAGNPVPVQMNVAPAEPARRGRGGVPAAPVVANPPAAVAAPVQIGQVAQPEVAVRLQAELAQREILAQAMQQQAQGGRGQQVAPAQQAAIEAQLRQLQLQGQLAQRQTVTVVEEVVVNENGVNRVVRRVRNVQAAPPINDKAAEKQHVWTNALENTLSADQRKQLAAADADRALNQNADSAAARVVAQIDQWLLLDPTQREKVTGLVNTALELPTLKVQVQRTPQLTPAIIDRVVKRLPAAEITSMLTPLQTTRWQQAVQATPAQLDPLAPRPVNAPAVDIIQPALPVIR